MKRDGKRMALTGGTGAPQARNGKHSYGVPRLRSLSSVIIYPSRSTGKLLFVWFGISAAELSMPKPLTYAEAAVD